MVATPTLTVRSVLLPGDPARPTEDRIFTTDRAVIVLDGATDRGDSERTGGWMAQTVGERLQAILFADPGADLTTELEPLIKALADEYNLRPGSAPSTTLSVLQVDDLIVRVSVLADSPVIVKLTNGEHVQIRDDRLAEVIETFPRPAGRYDLNDERWTERIDSIEAQRNRPGGFWTVTASPEAASQLVVRTFPINDVEAAILMTDGASALGDRYTSDAWETLFEKAKRDPSRFVHEAFELERSDPDCVRWPRSKIHDDKTIVVVEPDGCDPRS